VGPPDRAVVPPEESLPSIESFIRALPKVELHLHLEGSIEPGTLRELAANKGRLEQETEDWIRQRSALQFRYASLPDFLQAFKMVTLLLDSPSDYALATRRLIERLAAQRVRYAEISLSTGVILWKKQRVPAIFEAILAAAKDAKQAHGVRVRWIFDAVRHFGPDHVREVLGWARIFRDDGVVALGLGGDEDRGPAEWFKEVYAEAKDLGLHRTAHAGESGGPQSVRKAVEVLGAERIGHGMTAARDRRVMELLRKRRVPLEVCLSSNVGTGLVASVEEHPLPRFLEAGILVTLNSDDPAMFGATLEQELLLAAKTFSLSPASLAGLMRNAVNASFCSEREKRSLLAELPV
jgi:aminodeoxyfutalosine deaminase